MSEAFTPPFDVRLMNMTASALLALFGLFTLAALVQWAAHHRVFSITSIRVSGQVVHNNVPTLRANVTPRLAGNFFTLDLASTRQTFENLPWVRRAVVRRVFPNRIAVELQEHQAVAYWGAEEASRLLNNFGEVFEANVGEVEQESLPRLDGPAGQEPQVLAMYQALQPLFAALELGIEELVLSGRGGWTVRLDTGAAIELGRGSDAEVIARTNRFVRTLPQVTSRYDRRPDAVETADLRHADGYALRLRGVSTVVNESQKK
ncbi:MAG: cell division protein FtsQ/DivIB [Rhodoferax sp.]|nr:cell division protein FtsQ/DivIB [Rhodoferax sp.]MCW5630493.1 cell division protein FtsQ/DivIB [Rhodoferax sp.]